MRTRLLVTLLTLNLLALPAHAAFVRLAVLGDSLSDTGRLAQATSSATFGLFSIPNDPYYQGRFSNGPVWVDYYAAANPAILIGNVAVGGAFSGTINGRDNAADDDFSAIPLVGGALQNAATGLDSQLVMIPDVTGTNTAAVLWIGANDLNNATTLGFARPQDIVPTSLGNIGNAINLLLGLGVSELYVGNLPDLGKTPAGMASGQAADLTAATVSFNTGLAGIVGAHGPIVRLVDIFNPFNDLLANAASFGFTDVTTPCVDGLFDTTACSDPNSHLFWDDVHPTTGAHAIIADIFGTAFDAVVIPLPAGWVMLAPALAWLALRGRSKAGRRGPAARSA